MARGLTSEAVMFVDLSIDGQCYRARVWNCGEHRWCLVAAELPDGTRLPGSGREGLCVDVLLEAHERVSDYLASRIKRI